MEISVYNNADLDRIHKWVISSKVTNCKGTVSFYEYNNCSGLIRFLFRDNPNIHNCGIYITSHKEIMIGITN